MTFRHCGPRASATAASAARRGYRRPRAARPPRSRPGSARRGRCRVALDVPVDVAGLDDVAGREGRAADHAGHVGGDRLLVPEPVLDGADGALCESVGGSGRSRRPCACSSSPRLRARREAGPRRRSSPAAGRRARRRPRGGARARRSRGRARHRGRTPRPRRRRAARGRREEGADGAAADDANPRRDSLSVTSRPPVSPRGRKRRISAMTTPSVTRRVPVGTLSSSNPKSSPFSAVSRRELTPLTSRAPTTAPQRLRTPPITSMASVRKVRSRYTCWVVMLPSRCTSRPPANPARAPQSVKARRRCRWMSIPAPAPAAVSSLEARSTRPKRLRW